MSSQKETRSATLKKILFSQVYCEVDEYKPHSKLPPGSVLIGRMIALCKNQKGTSTMSATKASQVVASEVQKDWINKNVYPLHKNSIAKKIKQTINTSKLLRKS